MITETIVTEMSITDPIPLLVEHSACLCADGDVPCLKHNRVAFEVFFAAKHGVGPFPPRAVAHDGVGGYVWRPLCWAYHMAYSQEWDWGLVARLRVPGFLRRVKGRWCAHYPRAGSEPDIKEEDLAVALTRYAAHIQRYGPPK